jgi:hypothetical protein
LARPLGVSKSDPEVMRGANRLADTLPRLRTMILDTEIAVKDYPPQNIRNMNVGPLAALTERQKQRLLGRSRQTRVLSRALVMK